MLNFLKINKFLKENSFVSKMIVDEILEDMERAKQKKSSQDMSKTYLLPPSKKIKNEKVIVIDAGGTNFRSCLANFDENGNVNFS